MAVDKLVDSAQLDADLTSVANAIRTKGGTSAELSFPQGFVDAVVAISTGREPAPFNDVNFYDKDGTIVYSYSKAEFLTLDELPENPTHDGFISQGWNWTLQGAKAYVTKYGILDIGQTYITDDGATRITVSFLTDGDLSMRIYWTQDKADGVKVSWGDGSTIETVSSAGTGVKYLEHIYAVKGNYVISLMPDDDCTFSFGNSGNYAIWGAGNTNYMWANKITAVNYGKNIETNIGPTFSVGRALQEITFPRGLTNINTGLANSLNLSAAILPYGITNISINNFMNSPRKAICIPETLTDITGTNFMHNNTLIKRICLPEQMSAIPNATCLGCDILQQVVIPSGITSIGQSAFNSCWALSEMMIPATVTHIGAQAFYFMRGCPKFVLLPTTPPTLDNSNAFGNGKSGAVIEVPYSADHSILNAYKTATNWSALSSMIQEAEP